MTDEDDVSIEKTLEDLVFAYKSEDEDGAIRGFVVLIGGALADLHAIAVAVEKLAHFEITGVGEVLHGSTEPGSFAGKVEEANNVLTTEEWELIEALRRGDIKTAVIHTDPNSDPQFDDGGPWYPNTVHPPLEPYTMVQVWKHGGHTETRWANTVAWGKPDVWAFWRLSPDWVEWEGQNAMGPKDIPANVLVDIRFRKPSAGERNPDILGISPVAWNWQNEGRPTNADIVAWRYSAKQPVLQFLRGNENVTEVQKPLTPSN